jgi:hypothetical protein
MPRGCTFDAMAGIPSPWLLWAIRRLRLVQSEAAQGAVVRDFSRTTSTWSTSTIIINKAVLFAASEGAWQPRELELSDPLAQPCAICRPRANLGPLLPSQVPSLSPPSPPAAAARRPTAVDGACGWAHYRTRYRRHQPLHVALRPPEQGVLRHVHASYAIHMHASHHPLTLTNIALTARTLHRPRGLTSPDTLNPAHQASQAYGPSQGCVRRVGILGVVHVDTKYAYF